MNTHRLNMMTSSNGIFSALLAFCEGNPPVTGVFPSQRPVTRSFVFFDLRLNKRFSKRSRCWRFETPSHSLWRHCNESMSRKMNFIPGPRPASRGDDKCVIHNPQHWIRWWPLPIWQERALYYHGTCKRQLTSNLFHSQIFHVKSSIYFF